MTELPTTEPTEPNEQTTTRPKHVRRYALLSVAALVVAGFLFGALLWNRNDETPIDPEATLATVFLDLWNQPGQIRNVSCVEAAANRWECRFRLTNTEEGDFAISGTLICDETFECNWKPRYGAPLSESLDE